jgi:hypothetical protein
MHGEERRSNMKAMIFPFCLAAGLALAGLIAVAPSMAQAQEGCWRNGEKHPHGSKVGGYTCNNGTWER